MSILLEALKKSEEQRQLGTTPTLQTPGAAVAGPRSPTNRWIVGAMAMLAVAVMTWAGWSQFRPPANPATANAPATVADDAAAPAIAEAAGPVGRERTRGVTPAVGPAPAEPGPDSAPRPSAAEVQTEPRPLVSMGVPRERSAENKADQRRQLAQNFRSFATEGQQSESAAAEGAEAGEAGPVRSAERRAEPVDSAAALAEESAAAVARARPPDPAADDTISYWQIPASTRESMPELRIRVLVFADRAEDRFLLVNDQRLREGEELEPGLRLEEIRRDRAVFTYRNYRFHLKG